MAQEHRQKNLLVHHGGGGKNQVASNQLGSFSSITNKLCYIFFFYPKLIVKLSYEFCSWIVFYVRRVF